MVALYIALAALVACVQASDIQLTGTIFANTTTCSGTPWQTYSNSANQVNCQKYYGDDGNDSWLKTSCSGTSFSAQICDNSDCTTCVNMDTKADGNCTVLTTSGVSTPMSAIFSCSNAYATAPAAAMMAVVALVAVVIA